MSRRSAFLAGTLLCAGLLCDALPGELHAGTGRKGASGVQKTFRFVPDAADENAPPLDGATWQIELPTYRARFRMLDVVGRQAFLEQATGRPTDPFASRPDQPDAFLTFLLELENRSEDSLIFQSQNCWLTTRHLKIEYPIDLDSIRSSYSMLEREMPAAYEAVGAALYTGELILGPGERSSGLLVYRKPHPKLKRFVVELQVTLPSGEVASFRAPYRRVKG